MMDDSVCLICFHDINSEKTNIIIAQECNCVYKVHDKCIKKWCKNKSKCLICHKDIKIYKKQKFKRSSKHIVSPPSSINRDIDSRPSSQTELITPVPHEQEIPPRLSFFQRLMKWCFF